MAELSEAELALGRRGVACTQELAWIYGRTAAADLIVHVRARRPTCTSTLADDFPSMNPLSFNHIKRDM